MNIFQKTASKVILIIISVLTVGVIWYSPFVFKGYSPDAVNDQLVLARNMAVSGKYSLYNDHGVLIASDMIAEKGELSSLGNRFTAILYSKVINLFGWRDTSGFLLISIILNALALLAFSFIAFRLFGAKIALIFIFIYALLPTNWRTIYALGNYEFALFFLSLFFLFFLLGRDKKYSYIYFIFAGSFLSGAILAKESFLITLPILFAYLFLKKNFKMLIYIFAPVIVIMSIFYLPNFFGGDNIYKGLILKEHTEQKEEKFDFSLAGHLFPDYYTFRFDKEDFLIQYEQIDKGSQGLIKSLNTKKAASNIGLKGINLSERAVIGIYLFIIHFAKFLSLEDIGGPLVFMFGFLGLLHLRRKNLFLSNFFSWWIAGSILIFSFGAIVSRNHLMDFGWAIALLVSLGIVLFFNALENHFNLKGRKKISFGIFIVVLFLYGLLTVNHAVWGRAYEGGILKVYAYADIIKNKNISSDEIIATAIRDDEKLMLNFLSDKSLIVFRPETMEKIISQNKTKEVFNEFNIKHILGYSDELSKRIAENADVSVIATDKINISQPKISPAKSLLMNLVK